MDTGGDPDILVDLMSVSSDFEGELVVRTLEAAGIDAHVFSATARTLSWMIAPSRPIRVQVRRGDIERARRALEERARELEELDLDDLDGLDEMEHREASERLGRTSGMPGRAFVVVLVLMILLIVATVVRGLVRVS